MYDSDARDVWNGQEQGFEWSIKALPSTYTHGSQSGRVTFRPRLSGRSLPCFFRLPVVNATRKGTPTYVTHTRAVRAEARGSQGCHPYTARHSYVSGSSIGESGSQKGTEGRDIADQLDGVSTRHFPRAPLLPLPIAHSIHLLAFSKS